MDRCARVACCCSRLSHQIRSPKAYYFFLLILTTLSMGSMMLSSTQSKLMSIFRDFNATCMDLNLESESCQELTGYSALYKISCPVATFFLLLAGLSLRFPGIHKGYWLLKTVLLLLTVLASFLTPINHFQELRDFWIYLTLLGNILYVFLILYAILDSFKRCIVVTQSLLGEILSSVGVLTLWIVSVVCLFILHGSKCFTMAMILSANSVLSLITLLAACFARLKGRNEGRLVESGLVSLYVSYWSWSSLAIAPVSEPEWMHFKFFSENRTCDNSSQSPERSLVFASAFCIMLASVFYFFRGTRTEEGRKAVSDQILSPENDLERNNNGNSGGSSHKDSSTIETPFSLPAFYAVLSLALMFMTAQLTGWSFPDDVMHFGRKTWTAVSFKMVVAWIICGIYLAYLLVPSELFHFPIRDSTPFLRSPLIRRHRPSITGPQTSHI